MVYLGVETYNGVLFVESYDGNLMGFEPKKAIAIDILPISQPNSLEEVNIITPVLVNLPDQREQLWWQPELKVNSHELNLSFTTSDISGKFIIEIEGFSDKGLPVSLSRQFKVEKEIQQ